MQCLKQNCLSRYSQSLSQSSGYQQAYNPSATYSYGQVAGDNMSGYNSYSNAYGQMYSANGRLRENANTTNMGYAKMGMQAFGGFMM